MILYTVKNLLLIKDILKALPPSGINCYFKIWKNSIPKKPAVKELGKMKKDKIILKNVSPLLHF